MPQPTTFNPTPTPCGVRIKISNLYGANQSARVYDRDNILFCVTKILALRMTNFTDFSATTVVYSAKRYILVCRTLSEYMLRTGSIIYTYGDYFCKNRTWLAVSAKWSTSPHLRLLVIRLSFCEWSDLLYYVSPSPGIRYVRFSNVFEFDTTTDDDDDCWLKRYFYCSKSESSRTFVTTFRTTD